MKNLLSFTEFVNENHAIYEYEKNPSDMVPYSAPDTFNSVAIFNSDFNQEWNGVKYKYGLEYTDRHMQIPISTLKSDDSYKSYLDNKFYMCKPMEEVWPLLKSSLKFDTSSKMPKRNGLYDWTLNDGDIVLVLQVDGGGRGESKFSYDKLIFYVKDTKDVKKNIAMIKKFIKNECFSPNAKPMEQPK